MTSSPQSSSPVTETLQRAADYLYEETTKLDAPISMTACLVLAKHVLSLAQRGQQQIAAPGNDQLSKLWNAIVENTKGDGFWIGEILLTTLEREVGFNPAALADTSTERK